MLPNLKIEVLNSALFFTLKCCKVLCIKNTLQWCQLSNIIYFKQSRTVTYELFCIGLKQYNILQTKQLLYNKLFVLTVMCKIKMLLQFFEYCSVWPAPLSPALGWAMASLHKLMVAWITFLVPTSLLLHQSQRQQYWAVTLGTVQSEVSVFGPI